MDTNASDIQECRSTFPPDIQEELEYTSPLFLQDTLIKKEHENKDESRKQLPGFMKQTVASIVKRSSFKHSDYAHLRSDKSRRAVSFDETRRRRKEDIRASVGKSKSVGPCRTRSRSSSMSVSNKGCASERGGEYTPRLSDDDRDDQQNLLNFEEMRRSVDQACITQVPGIEPPRRSSASNEHRIEGGLSPLPNLGRRTRTMHSPQLATSSYPGDSLLHILETRSPSAPGSMSADVNFEVPRNTPVVDAPDRSIPQNNSSISLTDHEPEGVDGSPMSGYWPSPIVPTSDSSDGSNSVNEEDVQSPTTHSRSINNDKSRIVGGWNDLRTQSPLECTVPDPTIYQPDQNKHFIRSNEQHDVSIKQERCSSGVDITGNPPTTLVQISPARPQADEGAAANEAPNKSNIRGSLILAGLFTGIAVIIGRFFTKKNEK